MARIEPLAIHDVDPDLRHVCEESERQIGTSVSTRTYAKNPAVLKALVAFRTALVKESKDVTRKDVLRIPVPKTGGFAVLLENL